MKIKMLVAAAMLWAIANPAAAQTVEARNPASVEAALKGAGYTTELKKDGAGEPLIQVKTDGLNFMVAFYGCKEKINCTTVSFFTAFSANTKPNAAAVNNWNSKKRFGRVYLDNEGDPAVQFEVDLDDGGMSPALFIDNVEWFTVAALDVRKELAK